MPAHLLNETGSAVGRFAVVGMHDGRQRSAVIHVGLLAQAVELSFGGKALVHHVAPPLSDGTMLTHAVGWVADLTADQALKIEVWLQQVKTRIAASATKSSPELESFRSFRDYIVHPPSVGLPVSDPQNGRACPLRFSCAGFIEACYQETLGVVLVAHDALPRVAQPTLMELWRALNIEVLRLRRSPERQEAFLRHLGIAEGGDQAVLLPGYLLHALARDDLRMPYAPRAEDRFFPGP